MPTAKSGCSPRTERRGPSSRDEHSSFWQRINSTMDSWPPPLPSEIVFTCARKPIYTESENNSPAATKDASDQLAESAESKNRPRRYGGHGENLNCFLRVSGVRNSCQQQVFRRISGEIF